MYHHAWAIFTYFCVWNLTGLKSSNVCSEVAYVSNSRISVERKLKSSKTNFIFSQFVCLMATRNSRRRMFFWTRQFRDGVFSKWFLQSITRKVVCKTLTHILKGMNLLQSNFLFGAKYRQNQLFARYSTFYRTSYKLCIKISKIMFGAKYRQNQLYIGV